MRYLLALLLITEIYIVKAIGEEIPFRVDGNYVSVEVKFDGQNGRQFREWCVVDSAAQNFWLSWDLCKSTGCDLSRAEEILAAGNAAAKYPNCCNMSIEVVGGRRFDNFAEARAWKDLAARCLIGENLLYRDLVFRDYKRKLIITYDSYDEFESYWMRHWEAARTFICILWEQFLHWGACPV